VQLLQAQYHFAKRAYDKSLECYRKCLIRNYCLPLKARLGMAYCYFYLNKYEMAKACALRVLQLDPRNANAFICVAVVLERMEDFQGYFENLKSAY
jgi:tetratricopeptide (TPR) repeat protein